ncbi:MAG: AEC family transporter [Xenococcaceae cyanobacterium]
MWTIVNSIFWTSLGVIMLRYQLVPTNLPRLLGRSLYWIGVPLQILVLARRSDFDEAVWIPPVVTLIALLVGLIISVALLQHWEKLKSIYVDRSIQSTWLNDLIYIFSGLPWGNKLFSKVFPFNGSGKGSFVLASMLGNTGFIGLVVIPNFVDRHYWSWIVLYGVTHNLLGSYGLGAMIANYFSSSQASTKKIIRLEALLKVPSLWAFVIGYTTRNVALPELVESVFKYGIMIVVPTSFFLIGMQLGKLQGIKSLKTAIVPTSLKLLILPALVAVGLTLLGVEGDGRLALVMMSGMPTAFANVILAEEYNLDRQIAASTILLSTIALPLTLPLWLTCLG